jgi:phospholipid-binding lipoprotein MlaA
LSVSICVGGETDVSQRISEQAPWANVRGHLLLAQSEEADDDFMYEDDPDYEAVEEDFIADPLEPLNRVFFTVNDRLYFWILKPVAWAYSDIVPEGIRISVKNMFTNISTPVRVVNNLLQWKVRKAGNEIVRFGVNSTIGILGIIDYAKIEMDIPMQDEDLGQTFGVWGIGQGFYINWPLLGPSSLRDSIGTVGDGFLEPVNYVNPLLDRVALKACDGINKASLSLGEYEEIKKDAFDPYEAVKDIYHQYRKSKVER